MPPHLNDPECEPICLLGDEMLSSETDSEERTRSENYCLSNIDKCLVNKELL